MRPSSGRPRARRASVGAAGFEELRRDQRPHQLHAAGARNPLDRLKRLAVHHEVHVDPRLRPEEQAGQVGDGCDGHAVDFAPRAQTGEDHRDGRVGRDDHVRVVFGDRPGQRARAEHAEQPPRQQPEGQDVLEHPVDERVCPGEEAELDAVAILDDRAQHPSHRVETVDDRDLGVLRRGLDLLGEGACGRGMTLAHIGREDQDTSPAGDLAQGTLAVTASHTGK